MTLSCNFNFEKNSLSSWFYDNHIRQAKPTSFYESLYKYKFFVGSRNHFHRMYEYEKMNIVPKTCTLDLLKLRSLLASV